MAHPVDKTEALAAQARLLMRDVSSRINHYADLAEQMSRAADVQDVDLLLELSLRARHARASMSRARAQLGWAAANTAKDLSALTDIADAQARAIPGDKLFKFWLSRSVPDESKLLTCAQGVVAFVDRMLPVEWNYDEDVALLVGDGLEDVARVLTSAGQQRIIVFRPAESQPSEYPDNVTLVTAVPALYDAIRGFEPLPPRRLASKMLPSSSIPAATYAGLMDVAESCLRDIRVSRNTLEMFCDTWLFQGIDNLPALATWPSVDAYQDTFRGRPMVIVAPGPSLSKNIDQLHQFVGRALIVTFSHTLTALRAAGITPDLVVTADSNALQYHFDGFPLSDIGAMVSGATVNPDLYDLPAPLHITMGANSTMDSWIFNALGEHGLVSAGGSVATTAFALGIQWGCDPIISIGSDLSFSDGKYYIETSCDGDLAVTVDEDTGSLKFDGWSDNILEMFDKGGPVAANEQQLVTLPGYYGGRVPTTMIFSVYHAWFEHVCQHATQGTTVLNCTEGGAYIAGMDHIPLAEAFERYVANSPAMDVRALLNAGRDAQDTPARRAKLLAAAEDMADATRNSLSLAVRCGNLVKDCQRLPGPSGQQAQDKLFKAENRLGAELARIRFIAMLRQPEVERATDRARHAQTGAELLEASAELFGVLVDTLRPVLARLDRAIAGLRAVTS